MTAEMCGDCGSVIGVCQPETCFWARLEAAQRNGTFVVSGKRARQCAICDSYEHDRRAHGWTGRNMNPDWARALTAARRRGI